MLMICWMVAKAAAGNAWPLIVVKKIGPIICEFTGNVRILLSFVLSWMLGRLGLSRLNLVMLWRMRLMISTEKAWFFKEMNTDPVELVMVVTVGLLPPLVKPPALENWD